MIAPAPPKFDKTNHHYIPQFWLRYFADPNGQLWKRQNGQLKPTSESGVMAEEWLYTEFDQWWRPGDGVEDKLSKMEGKGALFFQALHATATIPPDEQWGEPVDFGEALATVMMLADCLEKQ